MSDEEFPLLNRMSSQFGGEGERGEATELQRFVQIGTPFFFRGFGWPPLNSSNELNHHE